jgi:type II secretory pathway component PulM
MERIRDYFGGLKKRERILISIGLFFLISIGIYGLIVSPLYDSLEDSEVQLINKRALLKKYYRLLSSEEAYKDKLMAYSDVFTSLQTFFLDAATEELAIAELQKAVKNVATRNGLTVTRSTATVRETINEDPRLTLVSGSFTLGDLDQVEKIQAFLYDIEHNNETIFFIDDFKLRGVGFNVSRGTALISTSLTAVARIKKR